MNAFSAAQEPAGARGAGAAGRPLADASNWISTALPVRLDAMARDHRSCQVLAQRIKRSAPAGAGLDAWTRSVLAQLEERMGALRRAAQRLGQKTSQEGPTSIAVVQTEKLPGLILAFAVRSQGQHHLVVGPRCVIDELTRTAQVLSSVAEEDVRVTEAAAAIWSPALGDAGTLVELARAL